MEYVTAKVIDVLMSIHNFKITEGKLNFQNTSIQYSDKLLASVDQNQGININISKLFINA